MPKKQGTITDEHPVASAIGKALGNIVRSTGLAQAEQPAPKAKKRLPRKLKKNIKKKTAPSAV